MVFNRFAAGNKVYGAAATSPTRGAVDPKGYIKRELARKSTQHGVSKVGRDGQSDTRSGLASQAMQRNGMYNNTGRAPASGMRAPKAPNQMQNSSIPRFGGKPNGGASPAPVGSPGAAPAPLAPAPAPVQVSNDGVLQLPYNSDFANQALDAQQAFDNQMMEFNFAEQDQSLDLAQFMRELETGYVDQQRSTLGNAAGNGMLYSSQYSTGANRDGTQYNNAKNDATSQNTNFMNQMTTRKNAATTGLNQLLQRITQGYADSLAGMAGSLGFGQDGAPSPVEAPAAPAPPAAPAAPIRSGSALAGGSGWGALGGGGNAAGGNRPSNGWGGASTGRPPKPSPNHTWNPNTHKWVKR